MNTKIIWISIIVTFILISVIVVPYTDYPLHHELHTISTFIAIILAILSFKGYINYKINRRLFSTIAFLAFGIAEGIEIVYDVEHEGDFFGVTAIRDYIIIAGLSLFALGTIPKK